MTPGAIIFDPQAPPAGAVWVPEVFERSGGANWIWYIVATLRPGSTQGRFPIPVFRALLAQGLATRGDVPGGFSDPVLDKMEAERLTPEERAQKDAQRARNADAARRSNCTAGEDCRSAGELAAAMVQRAPETANELGFFVGDFFGKTAGAVGRVAGQIGGGAAAGIVGGLPAPAAVALAVLAVGAVVMLVSRAD
jgi:hypothetical protein